MNSSTRCGSRNLAELEAKWAAFIADAEFTTGLASREESGPLYQAIRRRVVDASPFEDALDTSS